MNLTQLLGIHLMYPTYIHTYNMDSTCKDFKNIVYVALPFLQKLEDLGFFPFLGRFHLCRLSLPLSFHRFVLCMYVCMYVCIMFTVECACVK